MNRAFKYLTILAGGTPQPLIGTYLTASITEFTVQQALGSGALNNSPVTLQIADSSIFVKGDAVNIVNPQTFASERVNISAIPDATHIQVLNMRYGYTGGAAGTGAWVVLAVNAQSVYLQALDGNAGAVYIGTSPAMSTPTGLLVLAKLQTVSAGAQGASFSTSRQGLADTESLAQYWVDGTTGDSYLPSIGVV